MTRSPHTSKLLLVADPRRDSRADLGGRPAPRRYRLARLRVDPVAATSAERFEHLKRVYD